MIQAAQRFIVFYLMLSGSFAWAQASGTAALADTEDIFYQAITQSTIENYDKAIALHQKNIANNPNNATFYNLLGKNYFALKKYDEAESAYKKAIELDANQKWFWIDLYNMYYETKDYVNAIPVAVKIAEMDPEYQDDLVSLYFYAKQYDKVLLLIEVIERRSKISPAMQHYKFQAQAEYQWAKKSQQNFEAAKRDDPFNEAIYTEVIEQHISEGNFEDAFKVVDELARRIPDSDWAFIPKFRTALQNNQYPKAYHDIELLVKSDNVAQLMKHRIFNEYLIYVNKNEQHLSDLAFIVSELDQQDIVNVAKEVGIFFYNKNKIALAQTYLEKGIKNEPDDVNLFLLYIQTYLDIKDYQKAQTLSQHYLERYPSEAKLYYYLGFSLAQLNQPQKALKKLNDALDYLLDDTQLEVNIYKQMAYCYQQLGDEKQKETYFLKANQLQKNED